MTQKHKNIMLVISFIVLLILSYRLAIAKSLDLKQEYTHLKQQELLFKNTPKQLSVLKQKETYYDSLLTQFQLDGSSVQNALLKLINGFAKGHDLKVVSFLEPHSIIENNLSIKTYEFTIEGHYNQINQLIYTLEQKTSFGEIINLHFEKKKNFRTGRSYLQAKVLLKSYG